MAGKYQSFEAGEGSSDSHGKLEALRLPDMTGKRVLDLGCNEGFFCFAAIERGASEAVGIDSDIKMIEAARAHAEARGLQSQTRFIHSSWDAFNETGFDVVILTSALHYASDQAALIHKIASMLHPDGLFILEGGIIDSPTRPWTAIARGTPPHSDVVHYPNHETMIALLSVDFAPRRRGESVLQPGDNVPRFVWHCPKIRRMVVTLGALSWQGKSTLAHRFANRGFHVIDIDEIVADQLGQDTDLGRAVTQSYATGYLNRCIEQIDRLGLQDGLADLTCQKIASIPASEHVVIVMGMSLMQPRFAHALRAQALTHSLVLWESYRSI